MIRNMHQSILGTVCIKIINHLVKSNHRIGPNKRALSRALIVRAYPWAIFTNALVAFHRNTIAFAKFSIFPPCGGALSLANRKPAWVVPVILMDTRTFFFLDAFSIIFDKTIGTDTGWKTVRSAIGIQNIWDRWLTCSRAQRTTFWENKTIRACHRTKVVRSPLSQVTSQCLWTDLSIDYKNILKNLQTP